MGQKVHPLGFRVGITKKHQSHWFARFNKYKYSQSILEDRMIRETLSKLFPELLNPILNNDKATKKRDDEISVTPRITQIKIERGLIPYEVGIQIHAENCELLKSSIDNLKVKRELVIKLISFRRYLLNLKMKLKNAVDTSNNQDTFSEYNNDAQIVTSVSTVSKSIKGLKRRKLNQNKIMFGSRNQANSKNNSLSNSFKRSTTNKFRKSKQELKRERLIKKRLKKRQFIRSRYRDLILKGLFIKKNTNKITQKLLLGQGLFNPSKQRKNSFSSYMQENNKTSLKNQVENRDINRKNVEKIKSLPNSNTYSISKMNFKGSFSIKNTFSSRIKKKFVTLFIQKMNKKFLSHLKILLMNYESTNSSIQNNNQGSIIQYLPLGYNKQWSLNRLNLLKNQPIYKLNRMIVVLEQKLLIKLESLRKEFIAFGSISSQSSESLGYFQILNFLKNLKELVNKLKREQKLQLSITKNTLEKIKQSESSLISGYEINSKKSGFKNSKNFLSKNETPASGGGIYPYGGNAGTPTGCPPQMQAQVRTTTIPLVDKTSLQSWQKNDSLKKSKMESILLVNVLEKKLDNIQDECRQVKLIQHIKDIIKKHRTKNIYFYLSTIADASKNLKKVKQFTKRHADFLFGLSNLNSSSFSTCMDGTAHAGTDNNSIGINKENNLWAEKINNRVSQVLEKTSTRVKYSLQDIFLEQIEKQRNMCLENLQLIPKISIKFYSVNKKTLEQKASIVSESVVDALEKRKAFRKVIKDAKESLMRTPGVKGVKIQVAGRLNGAEIARTEWVRAGRVPLQTLRANLDYSYRTANTIYGIIGVRVWIFKGYVKKN
jgi:ribosomal protein S3